METALNFSGLKTKKAVIEAALKLFVQLEQQRQIKQWRGKLKWEGDLNDTFSKLKPNSYHYSN